MARREPTDRATLTLRLKEPLRADLEASAREKKISLNAEIVQRLEVSLADEKVGYTIFGDRFTYQIVNIIARTFHSFGYEKNKLWHQDQIIYHDAVETIYQYLMKLPSITFDWAEHIVKVDAAAALRVVEAIIRTPSDDPAADTHFPAVEGDEPTNEAYLQWREEAKRDGLERLFARLASRRKGESFDDAVERIARKVFETLNAAAPVHEGDSRQWRGKRRGE
jgi:hypothetical protein